MTKLKEAEEALKCKWCNGDMNIAKDLPSRVDESQMLWSACCTNPDCAFTYVETRGYQRKTDLLKDLNLLTEASRVKPEKVREAIDWANNSTHANAYGDNRDADEMPDIPIKAAQSAQQSPQSGEVFKQLEIVYQALTLDPAPPEYIGTKLHEAAKIVNELQKMFRSPHATGRLNAVPEWRPISEAPRDGEIIIMYGKSRHAAFDTVGTGHWYRPGKRFVWDNYLGDEPRPPTHWQPLPSPPSRPEERGG